MWTSCKYSSLGDEALGIMENNEAVQCRTADVNKKIYQEHVGILTEPLIHWFSRRYSIDLSMLPLILLKTPLYSEAPLAGPREGKVPRGVVVDT